MDLAKKIGETMKRVIFMILSIVPFLIGDIKINNQKWIQDYELLVNLNLGAKENIQGLDLNKNGVRDDVEYYVNQKYKDDPFEKEIFLESAKKIQTILSLPKSASVKKRVQLDEELIRLYACRDYMLYKLNDKNIEDKLKEKMIFKSKVLNTNDRLRAYIEHKKMVLDFGEQSMDDKTVDRARVSCEKIYQKLNNPDLITSN
jgi:hypothetical protein